MRQSRTVVRVLAIAGLVGGLSVAAPPAHAATISASGSTLRYVAAPGETNDLAASTEGATLILADSGAARSNRLPARCVQDPAVATLSVRCDLPGDWELRVELGDGDDRLRGEPVPRRIALRVDTGDGVNIVEGGSGDDEIVGGVGLDTLYGGPGNDHVSGGDGDDYVRGNGGDDAVSGGSGIDFVIDDGGDDVLRGGPDVDFLISNAGDDTVYGGGGNDSIDLGPGDDVAYGGDGDDDIVGRAGFDRLYGENGDDLLRTRDGVSDQLDCGPGPADVARVDAAELDLARRSCEKVREAD